MLSERVGGDWKTQPETTLRGRTKLGWAAMDLGKLRARLEGPQQEIGLPVLPPLLAVVELAVLVLAILGFDQLFPSLNITELEPSPFWAPVLLLSLQYGTVSGLLAAGTVIAITLLQGVPEQNVGENHFAYLLRIWAEPLLWIAVAVLLGQFRMRQIERKQELSRQVHELTSQRAAIAEYANNLRARCAALERELAGRIEPPAQRLLASLTDLRAGRQLSQALQASLGHAFGDARGGLYLLDDGVLKRAGSDGDHATVPGRAGAEIGSGHPLHRAVIGEGRSLSVLVRDDEVPLGGIALAAAPVHAPDGSIAGLVMIEDMPPSSLGPSTLAALRAIAGAIALAAKPTAVAVEEQPARTLRERFLHNIRLIPGVRAKPRDPAESPDDAATAIAATPSRVVR